MGGSSIEVTQLRGSWWTDRSLGEEWNALLGAVKEPSVFLTWEWVTAWWEQYGRGRESLVLIARRPDGSLCGIAPLMIGAPTRTSMRWLRRVVPIGQESYGEYQDLIVSPGEEDEVVPVLLRYLVSARGRAWDMIWIARMRQDSPNLPILRRELGGSVTAVSTKFSPYASTDRPFKDYLSARSGNFRQQYARIHRRIVESGGRLERAGVDIDFDEAFDEFVRLHRMRWQGGSFDRPGYEGFHRAFARRMLARGGLYLALLSIDGRRIAARYDFVFGGKMWCVQGGWDPATDELRPGTWMTGEALRWAHENGLTEYDFLAGDHEYKRRWATSSRSLVTLFAYNPRSPRGGVYRTARRVGGSSLGVGLARLLGIFGGSGAHLGSI